MGILSDIRSPVPFLIGGVTVDGHEKEVDKPCIPAYTLYYATARGHKNGQPFALYLLMGDVSKKTPCFKWRKCSSTNDSAFRFRQQKYMFMVRKRTWLKLVK